MPGLALQVGVVSDTHGLFDRKLVDLFAGSDLILHAGDVCRQDGLDKLASARPDASRLRQLR
jgi:predicted phosphodiesterase